MKKFFTFVAVAALALTASAQRVWDFSKFPTQVIDETGNVGTNVSTPGDYTMDWAQIYNKGGMKDEEQFAVKKGELLEMTKDLKWGILDSDKMVVWYNGTEDWGGCYLKFVKAIDVTIPAKKGQVIEFVGWSAKNSKKVSSIGIEEGFSVEYSKENAPASYTCVVTEDNPVLSCENNICLKQIIVKDGGQQSADVIYSWESPEGTPVEVGGTATFEGGDEGENRLNYQNTSKAGTLYYTMCLSGKASGIDMETFSKNESPRIAIALNSALKGGEVIAVTAYTNKGDDSKLGTPFFKFSNGTTLSDDTKTYIDLGYETNTAPSTQTYTVPAEAAGSTSLKMTRSKAGTNLFITKFVIAATEAAGISTVETVRPINSTIFNMAGQRIDAPVKGQMYIQNGKKYIAR